MFKEPKSWSTVDLEVSELGTITGLCFDNGTTQYLGLPYASVPGRFRRPQPSVTPWPDKRWDGTKLSPFPCQPPRDFYPIPNPERPWVENPSRMSATDCLSLNISVPNPPSSEEVPEGGYPVMIFFHGQHSSAIHLLSLLTGRRRRVCLCCRGCGHLRRSCTVDSFQGRF